MPPTNIVDGETYQFCVVDAIGIFPDLPWTPRIGGGIDGDIFLFFRMLERELLYAPRAWGILAFRIGFAALVLMRWPAYHMRSQLGF